MAQNKRFFLTDKSSGSFSERIGGGVIFNGRLRSTTKEVGFLGSFS